MTSVQLQHLRESFFKTVFSLLGHIANCDGYINRDEIKRTQTYMEKMKLTDECKRQAIQLFRVGANPQFDMAALLREFSVAAEKTPTIIEVLLVYLISLARIDGLLVEKEIKVVRKVAAGLGYSTIIFEHLLRMVAAQDKFVNSADDEELNFKGWNSAGGEKEDKNEDGGADGKQNSFHQRDHAGTSSAYLREAYEALGVSSTISDEELKRAYRKLVSKFHPDKLQGQGLPVELVKAATERFKKIQGAYDYIKKAKSGSV